jgi:thymidylate synthase (FAD)
MASLSVKSTRYTLKELKDERDFYYFDDELNLFEDWDRITKYINLTGVKTVDRTSMFALNNLKELIQLEITNDIAKYVLPECYKVDLIWSINARSLRNFLSLRTDPSAHFEIRTLAKNIYNCIPEGHKFIFEDSLSQVEGAGNATN